MVLRIKNFNIFGVHWKIWLLRVRGHKKPIYRGGLPKKGGLDSLLIQGGGGLARKRGVVFLRGVDTPMATMLKGIFQGFWPQLQSTYFVEYLSMVAYDNILEEKQNVIFWI